MGMTERSADSSSADAGQRDDHVRVADVDAEAGPGHLEVPGAHQRLAAVQPPAAEVDLEAAEVALHVADPAAGADRQGAALPKLGEAVLEQEFRVHADAVAAHLRRRPVGVVVIHEPLGRVVFGEGRGTVGQAARAHRADDAVGADAEVPVRDGRESGAV